jgi:hypothetical protein
MTLYPIGLAESVSISSQSVDLQLARLSRAAFLPLRNLLPTSTPSLVYGLAKCNNNP